MTVAEVTGSNSISVAEHAMMLLLSLVRNELPSHGIAVNGVWSVADCVARSYDIEGMHFGTIGAGRIGLAVLRRLNPFSLHLHYSDPHRLSQEIETDLGLAFHADAGSLVRAVNIIDMPLYPSTEHFFNDAMFAKMKRGAYLGNTARGKADGVTCLQGIYQSNQGAAAAVQVNNVNLVLGHIGRPGCGILQMNGQPTAQNSRETGTGGDLPGFAILPIRATSRNWRGCGTPIRRACRTGARRRMRRRCFIMPRPGRSRCCGSSARTRRCRSVI